MSLTSSDGPRASGSGTAGPPAAARCSVREGKVRYVYPWAAGRGCGIAPSDQRRPAVTIDQHRPPTPARDQGGADALPMLPSPLEPG
jgi:hypothetical protein